ncbi:hypothetical protein T4E_3180 [Trichinella pseudospiralis]|uniref:K Homology domain-containing protein n=1 Tax=Trichinella pseudospiralis TaxID=6337 RepID=A0A0V0XS61_TRIPS|nr:hypothetical protein T4E_3180 [Trichinella pseudospiralis]
MCNSEPEHSNGKLSCSVFPCSCCCAVGILITMMNERLFNTIAYIEEITISVKKKKYNCDLFNLIEEFVNILEPDYETFQCLSFKEVIDFYSTLRHLKSAIVGTDVQDRMFPKLGKLIDKCYQCTGLEAANINKKQRVNVIQSNGSTGENNSINKKSFGYSKFVKPKHHYYDIIQGWLKEQKSNVPTRRYCYKQVYLDIPERMLEDLHEKNINFKHTIEILANVEINLLKRKVSIVAEHKDCIDAAIVLFLHINNYPSFFNIACEMVLKYLINMENVTSLTDVQLATLEHGLNCSKTVNDFQHNEESDNGSYQLKADDGCCQLLAPIPKRYSADEWNLHYYDFMDTSVSFHEQQQEDLFFEPVKFENIKRRNPSQYKKLIIIKSTDVVKLIGRHGSVLWAIQTITDTLIIIENFAFTKNFKRVILCAANVRNLKSTIHFIRILLQHNLNMQRLADNMAKAVNFNFSEWSVI